MRLKIWSPFKPNFVDHKMQDPPQLPVLPLSSIQTNFTSSLKILLTDKPNRI